MRLPFVVLQKCSVRRMASPVYRRFAGQTNSSLRVSSSSGKSFDVALYYSILMHSEYQSQPVQTIMHIYFYLRFALEKAMRICQLRPLNVSTVSPVPKCVL